MIFIDRIDAGRQLGARLRHLADEQVVVLGLPRGGVPVAFEVARALDAPLDVIVVRKLGVPFQPELGMGAIGEGGVCIINRDLVHRTGVSEHEIASVEERERIELDRRVKRFRGNRERVDLAGRTALIVDDGVATGSTARAACQVARAQGAARIVLAVPVAPPGWTARFDHDADELIALHTPREFSAIGQFYANFNQTADDEVVALLERGARSAPARHTRAAGDDPVDTASRRGLDEVVEFEVGSVRLGGRLAVPEEAMGVVIFAHGSGSSSASPRNRYVASVLNEAGLGTLLFDLLTPQEESDRANVFDIELLAGRLLGATTWLRNRTGGAELPIGYFGASTGAAAALWAAGEPGADVRAVVSRGGRPDLAGERLGEVRAPTLLIVGGNDDVVLGLNRQAVARLHCENRLVVIPGAGHLFAEPGTLHAAAREARDWFRQAFLDVASQGSPALDLTVRSTTSTEVGPEASAYVTGSGWEHEARLRRMR